MPIAIRAQRIATEDFTQRFAETQAHVRRRDVLAEERDARVPHRLVQLYRGCETRSRLQHDPRHAEQPRLALKGLLLTAVFGRWLPS
jgi:hypothetical protein